MDSFYDQDLENLSGIKAHTLRIWEQRYHFSSPAERSRISGITAVKTWSASLNIALLNKYGFKISHIDRMNQAEIKEKILAEPDACSRTGIVNELIQHMIDLDMESLKRPSIILYWPGVSKAIVQIIFPIWKGSGYSGWQTISTRPRSTW